MMGIVDRFLDEVTGCAASRLYARRPASCSASTWRTADRPTGSSCTCPSSAPRRCSDPGSPNWAVSSRSASNWSISPRTRTSSTPGSGIRTGREQWIRAGYVVGCDGAHSRVRHLLGVPFTGQRYPWDWLLADTRLDWPGTPTEVHVFTRPEGLPMACVPITPDLWRVSLPTPGDRSGAAPTLDEIQALVDERGRAPCASTIPRR